MSDAPGGGDWWLATDRRWYPPDRWSGPGSIHDHTAERHGWREAADGTWLAPGVSSNLYSGEDEKFEGNLGSISLKPSARLLVFDRTGRLARMGGSRDTVPREIPLAALTSVEIHKPASGRGGWIQVTHGGSVRTVPTKATWITLPDTLMFLKSQETRFDSLRWRLREIIRANQALGTDPLAISYDGRPRNAAGSALDPLALDLQATMPGKVAYYLGKHNAVLPDEQVLAVAGTDPQVLVATDRRLLVVKVGWMAGSTGGGRTTAFNYADVTAIQVQLGIGMGTLSVQSPGYGASQTGDYWSQRNQQNPFDLPNVIPWSKLSDRRFSRELTYIRHRVDKARHPQQVQVAGPPDLAEQITRLGELHAAGTLTDSEFAAAKARLLG